MLIFLIFWLLFFVLLGSIVWSSVANGISPMPTLPKVRRRLFQSLPEVMSGTIYELGAGWGTLAFPLARRYLNCSVVAYETSWIPYLFCRLRFWFEPLPNLRIVRSDFYRAPLENARLVTCYLFSGAMTRLQEKFSSELPVSALVVSHTFAIPGWTPDYVDTAADLFKTRIYHYHRHRKL